MPKYWERTIGADANIGLLTAINPVGIVLGLIILIPIIGRHWDRPEAMWLYLGLFALAGCLGAWALRKWFEAAPRSRNQTSNTA